MLTPSVRWTTKVQLNLIDTGLNTQPHTEQLSEVICLSGDE
jgi:hypothetical protein